MKLNLEKLKLVVCVRRIDGIKKGKVCEVFKHGNSFKVRVSDGEVKNPRWLKIGLKNKYIKPYCRDYAHFEDLFHVSEEFSGKNSAL